MTNANPPAGRRRPSMAGAMAPETRGPMRSADGAIDFFKFRVAAQQFMNENGPLFAAFARASDDPSALLRGGSLAQAIEASTRLASEVARRVTGKPTPLSSEVRPFRHAAAEIVAHAWRAEGLGAFDVGAVAAEHAAAFGIVDEDLDRNLFQDLSISDEASIALTAAAVTLTLMKPVMVYDFRHDRAALVSGLSTAVMEMAAEASLQLLPDNAKPDERRSMLQTAANRLSDIMAAVYERKAKGVVAHIGSLPEAEKEAFARRYDPLPEIARAFRDWGIVFAATSVAAARAAAAVAGGRDQREAPAPRS